MESRAFVAALLTCTTLSLSLPARAYAAGDEPDGVASSRGEVSLSLTSPPPIFLTRADVLRRAYTPDVVAASGLRPLGPMKEVRLSSEAKTAIIVGAIVVGVLLIVGVVVLAGPGKKLVK
jgi:hypothetical protein